MNDVDPAAIEREEIRAIQGHYAKEHQALINWSRWARDLRRIYPRGHPNFCAYIPEHDRKEWDQEGYGGEVQVSEERLAQDDVKAEGSEREPYDTKRAEELDHRIHAKGGGQPEYLCSVLKVAYCSPASVQEHRFHQFCNPPCQPSTFRERLEDCLVFIRRFV